MAGLLLNFLSVFGSLMFHIGAFIRRGSPRQIPVYDDPDDKGSHKTNFWKCSYSFHASGAASILLARVEAVHQGQCELQVCQTGFSASSFRGV